MDDAAFNTESVAADQLKAAERVTLNLNIGGTLTSPKVSLAGGSVKAQAKDIVKEAVQSKLDDARAKLEERKQQVQDSIGRPARRCHHGNGISDGAGSNDVAGLHTGGGELDRLLAGKPRKHDFKIGGAAAVSRHMSVTGG